MTLPLLFLLLNSWDMVLLKEQIREAGLSAARTSGPSAPSGICEPASVHMNSKTGDLYVCSSPVKWYSGPRMVAAK